MSRKIEVVEEVHRYCCDPDRDLVPIVAYSYTNSLHRFCKHCGRHWRHTLPTPEWPHTLSEKQQAEVIETAARGEKWEPPYLGSQMIYVPLLFPWEDGYTRIYLPCQCVVTKNEGLKEHHYDCHDHPTPHPHRGW